MNYASRTVTAAPAIDLAEEKEFRLGAFLVRPSTREIVVDGQSESVEPRVMQALVVLAQSEGAVVSRDRLIERCWGGRIVGDDAINNCIGKVRALAALTPEPAFEIETVPRVGYRLIAAQSNDNLAEASQPGILQPEPVTPVGLAGLVMAPAFGWRKIVLFAALAIVLIATATVFVLRVGSIRPARNQQLAVSSQTTVAVLPFTPLYSDRNASVYADEISSDVADMLGQTDLNVIAPAVSFQFRGDRKADAARGLHADILVDGDVRRTGDNLDVAIRVEDVASGLILVSRDMVGTVSHAADLPDQIATMVAGALGWDVSIKALNSVRRWDPRVRTGILRAVFQCPHRQDPFCAYEVGRGLVSVAPDNPIAQSILAIETTDILGRLPPRERPAATAKAQKAAWTAIRLDPHLGEPYIALSQLTSNTAATESYLRQGLSADPDSSSVSAFLSALLYSTGRNEEGLAVIQRVAARYRFEDWSSTNQIWALMGLGRTKQAVEIAKRARRLWPNTRLFILMLFDAAAFGGNPADAEALLKDPVTGPFLDSPGEPPITIHIVRAVQTHRAEDIETVVHDCAHIDAGDWSHAHICLLALTTLGRIDDAFRLRPDDSAEFALFWPQTAPLRADSRFRPLAEKLGLLAYWKAVHVRPDFCATEHAPVCQALAP